METLINIPDTMVCPNANQPFEAWYCQSRGDVPAKMSAIGLCGHCTKIAELDAMSEPPSFMLPDVDL